MFGCYALSCKKADLNDNTQTCNVALKDTSFKIEELIGLDSKKFFETDKVVASREPVYFRAKDTTADQYLWMFEGDPRVFAGNPVSLIIDQPPGVIKVILKQKRKLSNTCEGILPTEVNYVKYLTIVSGSENPLIGSYLGYNQSNKNKAFSITIEQNGLKNLPFPTTGNYYFQDEIIYGASAFYIAGAGTYDPAYGAYATEGFGFLKDNKYLEIDYQYKSPSSPSAFIIKDTFYGFKQ